MKGTLYGVGIGPGDPELLTLKAVRLIRESEVIAVPGERPEGDSGLQDLRCRQCRSLRTRHCAHSTMPMTKDPAKILEESHDHAADRIGLKLTETGKACGVSYARRSDRLFYLSVCTQQAPAREGIRRRSSAASPLSARWQPGLNMSLVERSEPLHVIPASYQIEEALKLPGTKVLMKAGKQMKYVQEQVQRFRKKCRDDRKLRHAG